MWQVTKAGFASLTSRVAWRRLAHGVAIVFFLTHQAWAGVICHCQHENGAQQGLQIAHAFCLSAHHPGSASSTQQAGETSHLSASCSEEGAPGTDDQLGALPQSAMVCCHPAPQAEVQGITIPLQDPESIVTTQQFVSLDALAVSVPTYQNSDQPHYTRPLYLSLSCLLI